jgi:hypothetical protein
VAFISYGLHLINLRGNGLEAVRNSQFAIIPLPSNFQLLLLHLEEEEEEKNQLVYEELWLTKWLWLDG